MFIQQSTKDGIDLNCEDNFGQTTFHFACKQGYCATGKSDPVVTFLNKSVTYNIDLSVKIEKKFGYISCQEEVGLLKNFYVDMTGSTDSSETTNPQIEHTDLE